MAARVGKYLLWTTSDGREIWHSSQELKAADLSSLANPGSSAYEPERVQMRLLMISMAAMTVSTICLSAIFLSALYTPTRPAVGAWSTTISLNSDAR
jgi:hypothetical protein